MATHSARAVSLHPSPFLPGTPAYQEIEKKIEMLKLHQNSDPSNLSNYLAHVQCKRDLKESAKRGEIPEDLRLRVSDILSRIGFRTSQSEPRFRGFPVQSTAILFFSPRLWEVLFLQDSHPQENALLQCLSNASFKTLVSLDKGEKLGVVSLETLLELREFTTQVDIPELERIYTSALKGKIPAMNPKKDTVGIRTLYLLAGIWPLDDEEHFAKLLANLPPAFRDSLPKPTSSETLAGECHRFKRIAAQGSLEEIDSLSPEALYRLFYFVHEEKKATPLRLEIFEGLLTLFRNEGLAPKYCKELLANTQGSTDLKQRVRRDTLDVVLEGFGRMSVSPWHLFAESSYFQALMKSDVQPPREIFLSGAKAEGFVCLHALMRGRQLRADSIPPPYLLGTLEAAHFFQVRDFDKIKAEIARAIIAAREDSTESIASLSEVLNTLPCPELEEHVLAWLKKSPFFSFQNKEGKDTVAITIREIPPFATLKFPLQVLKGFKERHPHMTITFQPYDGKKEQNEALRLLCGIYCCNAFKLAEEKEALEAEVLKLCRIEDYANRDAPASWTPSDVYFLIGELSDRASTHFLEKLKGEFTYTPFWRSVKDSVPSKASMLLRKESAVFEEIAADPTGRKVQELSLDQLTLFLYFLLQKEKESPLEKPDPFLSNLSLSLSRCIKEKKLDVSTFLDAIRDCKEAFPENAYLVDTLKIDIAYPGADAPHISVPLGFLLEMKRCREILASGTMGDAYEGIPQESARWALKLLEKVTSENKVPLLVPSEKKNLTPSHFQALELLQKEVSIWERQRARLESIAAKFIPLADQFSKEMLQAVASWAVSVKAYDLADRCSSIYCGEKVLYLGKKHGSFSWKLSSLEAKPLEFLKAIGHGLESLDVKLENPQATEQPWVKFADACQTLPHLYLNLSGMIPPMETFPLSRLTKLSYLSIHPRDLESWEGLRSLKIPSNINSTSLFLDIRHIERVAPYEFFDNLPPKGVSLHLNDELRRVPAKDDPLDILFSHLQHCTELEVQPTHCRPEFARHARLLEVLKLEYFDFQLPSIDVFRELLEHAPNLKKCVIKSDFIISKYKDCSEIISRTNDFLEEFQTLENCNLHITITGSNENRVQELKDNVYPKQPDKRGKPEMCLKIKVSNYFG